MNEPDGGGSRSGYIADDVSGAGDPDEIARAAAAFAKETARREEYDAASRKPCSAGKMARRIAMMLGEKDGADQAADGRMATANAAADGRIVTPDGNGGEAGTLTTGNGGGVAAPDAGPRPPWLRVKAVRGENWRKMLTNLGGLHTVCQEANCPNIGECYNRGTATFMILGDTCTRSCGFCNVKMGKVDEVDWTEPERLAESVERLGLRHVVITSVNRDNLPDGGASVFAECIRKIRARTPGVTIEVLTPDFLGDLPSLKIVMDEKPEVFNHNVETVPRLYRPVRPQARYERSLSVLAEAKKMYPAGLTKSGLMVGLGEEFGEVVEVLKDLRAHDVDMVTIGQYLQPNKYMLPVIRYVTPEEFDELGAAARELGFIGVASGPLVRSSYFAENQLPERG